MVERSGRFTSLGVFAPFSSVALCVHGIAERVWQLQKKGEWLAPRTIFIVKDVPIVNQTHPSLDTCVLFRDQPKNSAWLAQGSVGQGPRAPLADPACLSLDT